MRRNNCGTCHHMEEGSERQLKKRGNFNVKSSYTWSLENLINVLTSAECADQYADQVSMSVWHRIIFHRTQIRQAQYRYLHVSEHTERSTMNVISPSIFPFYQCPHNTAVQQGINKEILYIFINVVP